jgi:hypothetical protein
MRVPDPLSSFLAALRAADCPSLAKPEVTLGRVPVERRLSLAHDKQAAV